VQIVEPYDVDTVAITCGLLGIIVIVAGIIIDVFFVVRVIRRPPDWRGLVRRLRSRPWTVHEGGALLLILMALQGIFVLCMVWGRYLDIIQSDTILSYSFLFQTLLFHGAGFVIIISIMRSRNISWRNGFGFGLHGFLKNMGYGVMFYVAAIPVLAFSALVYRLALVALGYSIEPQSVVTVFIDTRHPTWLQIYLVAMAIGVAPFVEELLFRGIALPLISKHTRIRPAVCLVSVLFAFMHFHVPSIVPLFVIATAFSLAYLYTGSIVVPIVMHTLFNGISLAALILLQHTVEFAL